MDEILDLDVEPPARMVVDAPHPGSVSGVSDLISAVMGHGGDGLRRQKSHKSAFSLSSRSAVFLAEHYPQASPAHWNDWRWQLKHRITTLVELERVVDLSSWEREALAPGKNKLPFAVTPYYASLLSRNDPHQPLRRCVIPTMDERIILACEEGDPLGEERDSPVQGIVHRYPDRVLFLVTDSCSTYCRYCTRSRRVGKRELTRKFAWGPSQWEPALKYIERNANIRDVLISGGDPLTMADHALEYLLQRLRAISHVEIIRIGTKTPMVLPQRITNRLVQMLRRYHPLFISIHCTLAEELTPESQRACTRLADGGVVLGGQTVLLKGINDTLPALTSLFQGLLRNRIRPYYLYHCDQVVGTAHFRTRVDRGLELIRGLRGHTSGYAIPQYVIDLPGGGGKTPLCPEYLQGRDGRDLLFRNYSGELYRVHDPMEPEMNVGGVA
ncbi:KamA family radical SAM protein [Desulfonatronum thioautotrophicum]|uniref:KamA family radical SAM protein n=1 Tax=Desulfonatronum thioautotrophicum TaxID=617001 RepID=UPI000AB4AAF2|nr:KamA family radical SAM protein [Desulfonatronum thioautotrophicum]